MVTKDTTKGSYVANKANLLWEGKYYQPGDIIPDFEPARKPSAVSAKLIVPEAEFDPKRRLGKPSEAKPLVLKFEEPVDPHAEFEHVSDEKVRRIATDYGIDASDMTRGMAIDTILQARVAPEPQPPKHVEKPIDLLAMNRQELVTYAKKKGLKRPDAVPTNELIQLIKDLG